jgi:hypothetical protein
MRWSVGTTAAIVLLSLATTSSAQEAPHNLLLFVPDGLRAKIVDATSAPALARLRDEGVNFVNSHSVFPTFTTANASAFATGHLLGDSGDFGNYIYSGFPVASSNNTVTPFLESDPVLREVERHFPQGYLNEASILALASSRYSTASIGKLGPAAIFALASLDPPADETAQQTLIVDDLTGHTGGIPLSSLWVQAFTRSGVATAAPGRGANGDAGGFDRPGTRVANAEQQRYFLDVALKVVLPQFKRAGQPFALVYWSRDPDGSQHNQGDSFGRLIPGINGPTSLAAVRSASEALGSIEEALKDLNLFDTTNIIVAADHGFSTISRASKTSAAAAHNYADVKPRELPLGFVAIDLAAALRALDGERKLFDPDRNDSVVDWLQGQHPSRGNGLIGAAAQTPEVIVAANGGSDLIYLPADSSTERRKLLAAAVVKALMQEDYASGIFVDEEQVGPVPGTLSIRSIGLAGSAVTPHPTMVVNFRSFSTRCGRASVLCAVEVADTPLQQGQGMHGSFSRADTWNFMAARGPDFNHSQIDRLPASNADIGATIARLLRLEVPSIGRLNGRVLDESLRGGEVRLTSSKQRVASQPASGGLTTVLVTERVGSSVYFDAAGFPGRTLGLANPTSRPARSWH